VGGDPCREEAVEGQKRKQEKKMTSKKVKEKKRHKGTKSRRMKVEVR
jgi:hypothetical protein